MRFSMGQVMTQNFATVRTRSRRAAGALIFAGLLLAPAMLPGAANAQALGYAAAPQSGFPSDDVNERADRSGADRRRQWQRERAA